MGQWRKLDLGDTPELLHPLRFILANPVIAELADESVALAGGDDHELNRLSNGTTPTVTNSPFGAPLAHAGLQKPS